MKKRAYATFACMALLLALAPTLTLAGEKEKETGVVVSTFDVQGMTCGGCAAGLRLAVKQLDGVEDVKVAHDDNQATVTYDTAKVSADQIAETIEEQGYDCKLEKTEKA